MPQALTQADINQLSSYAASGQANNYYTLLSGKGYKYAGLALGVVNNNTAAGVYFLRSFLVFALVLFLSFAAAAEEIKKVRFQMGGYEYEIPENYFDVPTDQKCNASTTLLVMLMPNFEAKTEKNQEEFRKVNFFHNQSRMLLTFFRNATAKKRSLDISFETTLGIFAKDKISPEYPYYGLKVYNPKIDKNNYRGNTVYANYNKDGTLESYIDCTLPGTAPAPGGCSHRFAANDVIVDFSYQVRYLPHWQDLEKKAREFVKSITVSPIKNALPPCCETLSCQMEK